MRKLVAGPPPGLGEDAPVDPPPIRRHTGEPFLCGRTRAAPCNSGQTQDRLSSAGASLLVRSARIATLLVWNMLTSEAPVVVKVAATNKYLARSNKTPAACFGNASWSIFALYYSVQPRRL